MKKVLFISVIILIEIFGIMLYNSNDYFGCIFVNILTIPLWGLLFLKETK